MVIKRLPLHKPPLPAESDVKPIAGKSPGNRLTFSDGLNFGCGFWVAGFLFTLAAIPAVIFLLALLGGF